MRSARRVHAFGVLPLCLLAATGAGAAATGGPGFAALAGSRPPALDRASDLGPIPPGTSISGAVLSLRRPPGRQRAFEALLAAQLDPSSPLYHHWLSAAAIGASYGPSRAWVGAVKTWLAASGLSVTAVAPSRMAITFSGNAAAIGQAFHTALHGYRVGSRTVLGSTGGEAVPAALAGIVVGVHLDGFRPTPMVIPRGTRALRPGGAWAGTATTRPSPSMTTINDDGSPEEDVTPADFGVIYDLWPLRTGGSPLLGAGETIAVIEDTDMQAVDYANFRAIFGLGGYTGPLTQIHPGCADPGTNSDEMEAALDAEWAGAVAPQAAIVVASCPDAEASSGLFTAMQGLVGSASPPSLISVSYGLCESYLGSIGARNWAELLSEAAAEGISVFVSSADEGSAGCDDGSSVAVEGLDINGLASTAYDVAVGGTDFDDTTTNTVDSYWSTTTAPNGGSALSYIPEIPWNDSCGSTVIAAYFGAVTALAFCNTPTGEEYLRPVGGGGGTSVFFVKPSWQSAPGVPDDAARDIPDVALFSAEGVWGHSLVYCMSDQSEPGTSCLSSGGPLRVGLGGGTSFAAPAFAGIQALIDDRKLGRQGNAAPRLYQLATTPGVFHDITIGGNGQPCRPATGDCYSAGLPYGILSTTPASEADSYLTGYGYDLATGLGSVDIYNLVNSF